MNPARTLRSLTVVAALALALVGCAPAAPATTVTEAGQLEVTNSWVKSADSGMSAAFGVLTNDSDADITVVAASTEVSPMVQLHETVEDADGQMVMQEKDGGFVVPAHGSVVLEPGGNHIMLMDVVTPIAAGDEVTFVLTLDDGSTLSFTAPGKDFTGADENYVGGDMDMGN